MASSSRRACFLSPDLFCYICGEYTLKEEHRKHITVFVKKAYFAYFKVKLGDQDKSWAPHIVCKTCVEHLRQWTCGKRKCLKFGIPMVWREPKNHYDDCYFCVVNIKGINGKNHKKWKYPDLDSARRPVPHGDDIPIPTFSQILDSLLEDETAVACGTTSDSDSVFEDDFSAAQRFNQLELNDLIRDLYLSKESSELLASRLKEKNY